MIKKYPFYLKSTVILFGLILFVYAIFNLKDVLICRICWLKKIRGNESFVYIAVLGSFLHRGQKDDLYFSPTLFELSNRSS
jgi:hypothetical protein